MDATRAIVLAALLAAGSTSVPDTNRPTTPFDAAGIGLLRSIGLRNEPYKVSCSPDGRTVAVALQDGELRVFDALTGRDVRLVAKLPEFAMTVAFSPDGRTLAAGGADGGIRLFDTATWAERATLVGHAGHANSLAWSADGKGLASAGSDGTLRLWDAVKNEARHCLAHDGSVADVAWTPDRRKVLSVCGNQSLRVWNAEDGNLETTVPCDGPLASVAVSPDGRSALVGGQDGIARLVDIATGRETWRVADHGGSVQAVAFVTDGRCAVTAGGRGAKLIDARKGAVLNDLRHHTAEIFGLSIAPRARFIATAGHDYQLKIWGPMLGGMARVRPKGFLGVTVQTQDGGAQVTDVIAGTAAEAAGFRTGDVLLRVGRTPVATLEEAIGQIGTYFEGDEVEFTIRRGGVESTIKARLGKRPENLDR